jgi:CheY-like chemotaxis protein
MSESNNKRVLVVEDNADLRLYISLVLKRENYEVLQANSGIDALELLETSECPDLILVDLSMPHMSGMEFLTKIKIHPKCPNTKTVIVSGWDDLELRAKEAGAHGYVKKPMNLDSLITEVRRHI